MLCVEPWRSFRTCSWKGQSLGNKFRLQTFPKKAGFVSAFGLLKMWKVLSVLQEMGKFLKKTEQRSQTAFVQWQTQALVRMRALRKLILAF